MRLLVIVPVYNAAGFVRSSCSSEALTNRTGVPCPPLSDAACHRGDRRSEWSHLEAGQVGLPARCSDAMSASRRLQFAATVVLASAFCALLPGPAEAYVGPGAGFAFVGSFFVLLWALALAVFTLLTYPFRVAWRAVRRRRLTANAPRRVIVIGLDGMDPKLTERMIAEGKLPNFAALASAGSFRRLATTHPPLSPVAWSSFMTGVHPARHGIFDFLARDARSYLPFLSSSAIEPTRHQFLCR